MTLPLFFHFTTLPHSRSHLTIHLEEQEEKTMAGESKSTFKLSDCVDLDISDDPTKMRSTEKSFQLSDYTHLDIIGHAVDFVHTINLTKKSFDKNISTAILTLEEWKELALILPNVKENAQCAWNKIQAGETPLLHEMHRILSDRFMLILNIFTAPNGNNYITTGVRLYYYGKEGQMLPKRDGGVTLSFEELSCLVDKLDEINSYISAALSNVKTFVMRSVKDMFNAQRFVEDFWKNGAENGSCCRLFLEKRSSIGL